MIPIANRIESGLDTLSTDIRREVAVVRQSVDDLGEHVADNQRRNVLLEYMVTHALDHGIDVDHRLADTPAQEEGADKKAGG